MCKCAKNTTDILVALHPQPADPDGPYKLIQALEGAEEA